MIVLVTGLRAVGLLAHAGPASLKGTGRHSLPLTLIHLQGGASQVARCGHAVADTALVEEVGRVRRVVARLASESSDEEAHAVRIGVRVPGQDEDLQRHVGHDPSRVERGTRTRKTASPTRNILQH